MGGMGQGPVGNDLIPFTSPRLGEHFSDGRIYRGRLRKQGQALPRLARGGPPGTSSPPTGHSTPYGNSIPYGKYVSNKRLKAENLQGRYYQWIFQLSNSLFFGEIILKKGKKISDKEELVVDKEKKISSLKL